MTSKYGTWQRLRRSLEYRGETYDEDQWAGTRAVVDVHRITGVEAYATNRSLILRAVLRPWYRRISIPWDKMQQIEVRASPLTRHGVTAKARACLTARIILIDSLLTLYLPWISEFDNYVPTSVGLVRRPEKYWLT